MTRIEERPGIADLDAPHAVSLTIGQPIAVKDALMLLLRGTAFSVALGEDVEGTFSGELKDLTLRQAVEAVLRPQGLDYTLDGQLIAVHRRKPAMRLFDVGYLNVQRTAAGTSYYDEIDRGVVALLSADGKAHVDRRHGVVQVTDFQERLDRVSSYLETVHVRALRQVRLTARVVEVTLSDPAVQAVDWKAVAQRSGEPWDGTGTSAGVRVNDFTAVLSALAAQGTLRTLASPQLLAMNNEPALMRVGTQDVSFTTAGSKDPAYTNHGEQPAAMTQGFTMTVTPHVDAGGMVQLSLAPTFTEKTGTSQSTNGSTVPVVSIAEVDTVVRIRDGESVMVTGMLQRKDTARCELVILLQATIVTPGPVARTGAR